MNELDLSRAIRSELARHLRSDRCARVGYVLRAGMTVNLADAAAAQATVSDLVGDLRAGASGAPSVLSVERADAGTVVVSLA